ncbi:O-antigen ligase family protein [Candidatus Fermentibacteria bacterium]|nr:O-antigen ligase family protein [Candidatus Fermentibacteria bacterium]
MVSATVRAEASGVIREGAKIDRSTIVRILLLVATIMAAQQTPWPGAPDLQALVPVVAGVAIAAGLVLGEIRWATFRMPVPLLLLLGLAAVSAAASPAPWIATVVFMEKSLWILGAVALVSLFMPAHARWIAMPVLIALTVEQVTLGAWQTMVHRREAWGSLGTPNALARYVLMVWPLVTLPLFISYRGVIRGLGVTLGVALVLVLIATSSRMAWVAFSVQALYLALRSHRRLALVVLAVAVVGMLVGPWGRLIRADDIHRILAWRTALALAWAYPLLGTGLGTFGSYYGMLPPSDSAALLTTPHNLVLHLACELGVLSLPLLAWLIIDGWRRLAEAERRANPFDAAFLCASRVIIVGMAIQSLVEY